MDQHRSELGELQAQDHRRGEKRLARGLEDVSYLFLSQTNEDQGTEEARGSHTTPAGPERAEPGIPTLLRPSSSVARESLISLLRVTAGALEEGMRTIDTNIPCDAAGAIDLLTLDNLNQLAIIDIGDSADDGLFLRGISHYDWFVRNVSILRRMYRGYVINFSAQPKVMLIAPRFSPLLICAAQRISVPEIKCFAYRAVITPTGTGVLFEPC